MFADRCRRSNRAKSQRIGRRYAEHSSGWSDPGPSVGIFTYSLPSALQIDIAHETVTLPLHKGAARDGRTIWYVVTESSNQTDAALRGVNYSNKMLNAVGTAAVQKGSYEGGVLVVEGTVNFGLTHVLVPGPTGFPPAQYAPGAQGDAKYSPLVQIVAAAGNQNGNGNQSGNDVVPTVGAVLNAPQVANETGLSGSVVAIDYNNMTVTLNMLAGYVDGQFTLYLHTDASSELIAALESSTYTPNLNAAPGIANDEPPLSRAAIIPVVNGIRGDTNPMRQGLQSSRFGEGDPFNVPQEQPSDPVHYTPIWDVTPVMWTDDGLLLGGFAGEIDALPSALNPFNFPAQENVAQLLLDAHRMLDNDPGSAPATETSALSPPHSSRLRPSESSSGTRFPRRPPSRRAFDARPLGVARPLVLP